MNRTVNILVLHSEITETIKCIEYSYVHKSNLPSYTGIFLIFYTVNKSTVRHALFLLVILHSIKTVWYYL